MGQEGDNIQGGRIGKTDHITLQTAQTKLHATCLTQHTPHYIQITGWMMEKL